MKKPIFYIYPYVQIRYLNVRLTLIEAGSYFEEYFIRDKILRLI